MSGTCDVSFKLLKGMKIRMPVPDQFEEENEVKSRKSERKSGKCGKIGISEENFLSCPPWVKICLHP